MSKLLKLAEQCERATGPDRVLDAEIYCAVTSHPQGLPLKSSGHGLIAVQVDGEWFGSYTSARNYTASIDAAMTLVPDGCCADTQQRRFNTALFQRNEHSWAAIEAVDGAATIFAEVTAQTVPLALCAAALRARASQEQP